MTSAAVTELPRKLEPTSPDTFIRDTSRPSTEALLSLRALSDRKGTAPLSAMGATVPPQEALQSPRLVPVPAGVLAEVA
jgi:hypothetical protein